MTFTNIKKRIASKEIQLTQGKYAIIDEEDYDKVKNRSWWYDKFSGARSVTYEDGAKNPTRVSLSRYIMDAKDNEIVDHANHNKLDNRKANLRVCTQSQNMANRRKGKSAKLSRYKGVRPDRLDKKWRAAITKDGKWRHIGTFETEEEAAMAYDREAIKLFGEFALPNIIGN